MGEKRTGTLDLLRSRVGSVEDSVLGGLQVTLGLVLGVVGSAAGAVAQGLAGRLVGVCT